MKTKDKILVKALELFNKQGIGAVSSRNISDAMGISYGNLCYHYPKKRDIIEQLYFNMQKELGEQFQQMRTDIFGLDFMVRSLRVMLELLFKYKFIYIDFTNIIRQFPSIKTHTQEQFEQRRFLMKEIARFLIQEGYMKEEKIKGHYDMVIHSLLIIINSFITDAEAFTEGTKEEKIAYYLEMFYSCVRMSLTRKGLEAFNEVYQFDEGLQEGLEK